MSLLYHNLLLSEEKNLGRLEQEVVEAKQSMQKLNENIETMRYTPIRTVPLPRAFLQNQRSLLICSPPILSVHLAFRKEKARLEIVASQRNQIQKNAETRHNRVTQKCSRELASLQNELVRTSPQMRRNAHCEYLCAKRTVKTATLTFVINTHGVCDGVS